MATLEQVTKAISSRIWVSRQNGDGFESHRLTELRPYDNIFLSSEATQDDVDRALEIAKSKELNLVNPQERKNGCIQLYAVPL